MIRTNPETKPPDRRCRFALDRDSPMLCRREQPELHLPPPQDPGRTSPPPPATFRRLQIDEPPATATMAAVTTRTHPAARTTRTPTLPAAPPPPPATTPPRPRSGRGAPAPMGDLPHPIWTREGSGPPPPSSAGRGFARRLPPAATEGRTRGR
nr:lysine-rich arabinogalactan protein 19-like [Aegilops tauschii subsp. strangulata]